MGFRTIQPLELGQQYTAQIRGIGLYSCKIVNHSSFDRYGAIFLISDRRKRSLEEKAKRILGLDSSE